LLFTAESSAKMNVCSDVSDYTWLTGDEAAVILRDLSASELPLHTAVAQLRRHLSPQRTHLAIELVELRRRAKDKFSAADRMFFTRTTLEQATDEHVARYKALRFVHRLLHGEEPARAGAHSPSTVTSTRPLAIADLCCGIGGDLMGLAELAGASSSAITSMVAVDVDPVIALYAAANVRAVLPSANIQFRTTDASEFDLEAVAAWHIDPDRRSDGRRTTSLEAFQPGRTTIERFLRRAPHAAIKLAPATKVPAAWAEQCELEWMSRGGECRQLVAWHGELAEHPGQNRATILSHDDSTLPRTFAGTADRPVPTSQHLHEYVYDFDPAVLAAHLQGELAAAYNMCALDSGPTYYTGAAPITDDPALACFQIDDVLPFRVPELTRLFRKRGIGAVEIKKRGVDIVPEKLRQELKLNGENSVSLLVAKIAGRATAVLARRVM
jgi:hypothetical protein